MFNIEKVKISNITFQHTASSSQFYIIFIIIYVNINKPRYPGYLRKVYVTDHDFGILLSYHTIYKQNTK